MSTSSPSPIPAPPRTIEIIVEPDGSTSVETRGYTGATCREAAAFIERALGQVTNETLKPEFHQPTTETETQRQRQNERA